MRAHSLVWLVALAMLASCGGPAEGAAGPEAGTTEGGTGGAEVPALGPLRTYVPDDARVVARIDVARIRRSPVGPDIAGAIMASATYQSWAHGSGLDPVADLDAILIAGPALYADRRVIVLRTTGDEARARHLVLRMGVARGVTPAWREEAGFAVATYPDPEFPVPHVIVLTAESEVVIAPEDDLPRILEVARDHARRRSAPEDVIEPGLSFAEGEVAWLRSDDPLPARPGYPTPPDRFRLDVREDASTGRTQVRIHGTFSSEPDAAAAQRWLEGQARELADNLLVRMAQLNRPLAEASFSHAGTELDIATDFTNDELRRALGAMAMWQAASDTE